MVKQNIVGPLREQSDWEQQDENRLGFIKNKPFYDTRETAPLNIEWDRANATNIEEFIDGRETVDFGEFIFVKMSEVTPTFEEMLTAEWYLCFNNSFGGNAGSLETTDLEALADIPCIQVLSGDMKVGFVARQTTSIEGVTFTKGLYFALYTHDALSYPYRLYIPSVTKGELKTIDSKFLPSGGIPIVNLSEIDLTSGLTEFKLPDELVKRIGTDMTCKCFYFNFGGEGLAIKCGIIAVPIVENGQVAGYSGMMHLDGLNLIMMDLILQDDFNTIFFTVHHFPPTNTESTT